MSRSWVTWEPGKAGKDKGRALGASGGSSPAGTLSLVSETSALQSKKSNSVITLLELQQAMDSGFLFFSSMSFQNGYIISASHSALSYN